MYWSFFYKKNFKKSKNLFHIISYNFNNPIIRNCKFLLVYWNRILSLFLKFFCLLICRDQNKENFIYQSFFICCKTTSTTQRHALSIAVKNWKLSWDSALSCRSLAFLDVELARNWRLQWGFFQEGNTENEQARNQ